MNHSRKNWGRKLTFFSCWVMGFVIATSGNCAHAQSDIIPDNTLGVESSVVTPNVIINNLPSEQISGGAIRGINLFHSFEDFNIDPERGAYFTNPAGIENILSRVTGDNPSEILGRLGVLGNANLFLINPNGVIFGENASLDVRGSFVATTANAIGFDNQGFFSASAPNVPPLLTVNPSAFLFNQIANSIENNSTALAGLNPSGRFPARGLRVPDGKSLLLVGGDILFNGGNLNAFGGRVELASVAEPTAISLNGNGNNLSLNFPNRVARGDVSLSMGAGVDVTAGGGGSINIYANDLDISRGSRLAAGVEENVRANVAQAGDITLNATGEISIFGPFSSAINMVRPNAVGNAGNITIQAGSLLLNDEALLNTATFGQGNAGNVSVNVNGDVTLLGNSEVLSSTSGQGNAGRITVNAQGNVSLDDSLLGTDVTAAIFGTQGNGGDINIQARSLSLNGGAKLFAVTMGGRPAGNIKVDATDSVTISGFNILGLPSGLFTNTQGNATRNGGEIRLNTGTLNISNGGVLSAVTRNQFDGGKIAVNVNNLKLEEGRQILTSTFAIGLDGLVQINSPNTEPRRRFFNLLTKPSKPQVLTGCLSPRINTSSFVITGRGGLPDNPRESFEGNTPLNDWVTLNGGSGNSNNPKVSDSSPQPTPSPIVEATSWRINDKGEVILIADASAATSGSSSHPVSDCSATKP